MTETKTLLVGVDVHRQQNVMYVMDQQGCALAAPLYADNNRPGTEQVAHDLATHMRQGGFDQLRLAAEATGWYWWHFFVSLEASPFLQPYDLHLYALNPRLTANFKKTYGDMDHTDTTDAFVIADRLRMGRDLPAPFHYETTYLPLRFLTRYRVHLVHQLVREKSYYLACLYLKASDFTRIRPFADVFGKASRALIEDVVAMEAIAALPLEELTAFIDEQGKHRFADPAHNAQQVQQVAHQSYCLPLELHTPLNLVLKLSGQRINSLQYAIQRLDHAITEQLKSIPHSLDTIPGIGLVFAAGILAEIGDLARFDYDHAKVAKYAGFKWSRHQSGDFTADHSHLTSTGNRYLRYFFCEAANSVRMHDADYKAFYLKKFHEVRQHQHKRAVVLTARKLVRLVVRLLTTNQPYQPARCSA
jgi:transposase